MSDSTRQPETVEQRIKRYEGLRLAPYVDSTGNPTVGYGHRIGPITLQHAEALFSADFAAAHRAARRMERRHGIVALSDVRFDVLIEMAFNLGEQGLQGFVKMWAALRKSHYQTAAAEILDSKAARQEPDRYTELATIMRTGEAK